MAKYYQVLWLCLAMDCLLATFWGVPEINGVAVLSKDNFENFIGNNDHAFVLFYSQSCKHCKDMESEYSALAKKMKDDDKGIPIAQVDASIEKEISKGQKITAYPILRLFLNKDHHVDYNDLRTAEAMYSWLVKKTGQLAERIDTLEQVYEIEKRHLAVLLSTLPRVNYQLNNYRHVALQFDNVPFYYTTNESIKQHYGLKDNFAVIVLRSFNSGRKTLSSLTVISEEKINEFINKHRVPWVAPFDEETGKLIFREQRTALFVFLDDDFGGQGLAKFLESASRKHKDVMFSTVDQKSDMGRRLSIFFGMADESRKPAWMIYFERGNLLKYRLDEVTQESILKFLEDFKMARLKPHFRSQEPPVRNDGLVKIAVGTTFDSVVTENEHTVLVIGYAAWSEESTAALAIFEQLAQEMAAVPNLLFVKVDAGSNEHYLLSHDTVPVFKLFKKGLKKSPIEYHGEPTRAGLLQFLELSLADNFYEKDLADDSELGHGEGVIDENL